MSPWRVAKPLVMKAIDQDLPPRPRGFAAFYPAALPLSRPTLDHTAGIIGRRRKRIASLWRTLNPGRQALPVLAYLRQGETFRRAGRGTG
jgi:hypothetical protein